MKKLVLSLSVAASAFLITLGAHPAAPRAQMFPTITQALICGDRAAIVERLHKEFSEQPFSVGLANSGTLVEVFASKAGTWTILVTQPGGTSCLVAAGDNWQAVPTLVGGPSA